MFFEDNFMLEFQFVKQEILRNIRRKY